MTPEERQTVRDLVRASEIKLPEEMDVVGSLFVKALPGLKVLGMGLLSAVAAAAVQYLAEADYGAVFGPAVGGAVTAVAHLMRNPLKA